nr:1-deoxy-D-xylulose-5-phosphate synthase [Clostridia bacterium]
GGAAISLAADFAAAYKNSVKVIAARVVKPLDEKALSSITTPVITIEENVLTGGFGQTVAAYLAAKNPRLVYSVGVNDKFVAHGSVKEQLEDNGFTVDNLISVADGLLDNTCKK